MAEKQAMAKAFVRPVEEVFTAGFPPKLDLPSDMLVEVNMLVCKDRLGAIALGKRALEEAAPELVLRDEESYRDSAEMVRLIKENLKLWSDPKGKDPENTLKVSLGTALKGSPPPPVVPDSVPAVAPISFKNPGDWGYEVHEGPSLSEMRSRKKAGRRGLIG